MPELFSPYGETFKQLWYWGSRYFEDEKLHEKRGRGGCIESFLKKSFDYFADPEDAFFFFKRCGELIKTQDMCIRKELVTLVMSDLNESFPPWLIEYCFDKWDFSFWLKHWMLQLDFRIGLTVQTVQHDAASRGKVFK